MFLAEFGAGDERAWDLFMTDGSSEYTRLTNDSEFSDKLVSWSPDGSHIAFLRGSRDDAGADLWVWNSVTYVESKLNVPTVVAGYPSWSPDGKYLAFLAGAPGFGGDLYIWDNITHGISKLNDEFIKWDHPWGPSWSPDGERLIAATMVFSIHGGPPEEVLPPGSAAAQWSPDGRTIAYQTGPETEIGLVSADGTDVRHLGSGLLEQNAWSPDGAQLAFTLLAFRRGGVFVIKADGTDMRKISSNGFGPVWSPVSEQIAFMSSSGNDQMIRVVDLRTGSSHTIKGCPHLNIYGEGTVSSVSNPVWSPDGRQIAFYSGDGLDTRIFLVNTDGSDLRELEAPAQPPEFRATGTRMVWIPAPDPEAR